MADREQKGVRNRPSFAAARTKVSHKQVKRDQRTSYRQFVNRFKSSAKEGRSGERQTAESLGFRMVRTVSYTGKARMARRPA